MYYVEVETGVAKAPRPVRGSSAADSSRGTLVQFRPLPLPSSCLPTSAFHRTAVSVLIKVFKVSIAQDMLLRKCRLMDVEAGTLLD